MMNKAQQFFNSLKKKTGAEVINHTATGNQLRLMLRIQKGRNTTMWLNIVERILERGDEELKADRKWTVDISKQYFLKPTLKYGWRVIFQGGTDLYTHIAQLATEVDSVQLGANTIQEQEIPLYGNPNRSPTAGPMGSVPLGQAAK